MLKKICYYLNSLDNLAQTNRTEVKKGRRYQRSNQTSAIKINTI